VGFQKATALMMLGDKVSATEAERLGMIYQVFTEEQFEAGSFAIARKLASLPAKGLAYTKEALNASLTNTLVEQLNKEDALQFKAANTYDYKEGVQAFLEKRTPVFKGE
jgi:2-(1,2-epoxy-1,2-dihydrophenyl)acetyl-CoA isomerase